MSRQPNHPTVPDGAAARRHGRLRRRCRCLILVTLAWLCAAVAPVQSQDDARALQQQAIARIDAALDVVRDSGDVRDGFAAFALADQELAASNAALGARAAWAPLALGLTKRASLRRILEQPGPALALYRQAAEAARRAGNAAYQADATAWASTVAGAMGDGGRALDDAREALRLAETTADNDVIAHALEALGTAQLAQQDLAGAADTFEREVAAAGKARDPMTAYTAYINRADLHLKSGRRCAYERDFKACYQALDRARADYRQALAIVRGLGHAALAAAMEASLSDVEAQRSLIAGQERLHAAMLGADLFQPKKAADVLVNEQFVPRWEAGELLAVMPLYRQYKRLEQSGYAEPGNARGHYIEAVVEEMQGHADNALDRFLQAVDSLQHDRRVLRDERARGTVLENRIEIYYAAMLRLLQRRDYAEAFRVLDLSRGRAMADLLASRSPGLGRPREQALYAEWMTLRSDIGKAQQELFELTETAEPARHDARIRSLQANIRQLDTMESDLRRRIDREAPRVRSLATPAPVTLDALQRSMRAEGYEMLQYVVLEQGIVVWHITPDGVYVRNVFLPRSELMRKTGVLLDSLRDPETAADMPAARELFLYLVQPVVERVRARRLVIVPHEALGAIPFQALQDPASRAYLGERLQLTYAPSASILLGLRRAPGIAGGRLLAVADPGVAGFVDEVRQVARLFPDRSKVSIDHLASESELKAWIGDYDVVHLGVHGKYEAEEPLRSYLQLAPGGGDGRLTAAEMFGLPLDRSRLVVLSACEMGRAESTHANEILGTERALLYAGAGTLVLSLWKIDSAATALWMQTFYRAAQSGPVSEVARVALQRVKAQYGHPYYWAAFTMVGR